MGFFASAVILEKAETKAFEAARGNACLTFLFAALLFEPFAFFPVGQTCRWGRLIVNEPLPLGST